MPIYRARMLDCLVVLLLMPGCQVMKLFQIIVFFFVILTGSVTRGQTVTDSSELKEVVVKAYFSERPLLKIPASVNIIGSQVLQNQPGYSLVPAMNTAPGVRMEERSPGSYRLSIRGSLLRSPFGIRNVKIYLDDFLLTDAGGNTYLNILDASSVGRIEILKGPEGSIFGANSGGVVLISSRELARDSSAILAGVSAGSYGLAHQSLTAQLKKDRLGITLNQSFQRSDGYRQNSAMNRKSVQLIPQWRYSEKGEIKALVMYSDLEYQTPGGLTSAQYQQNPRLARPGAAKQQVAIYNKTMLAGISHSKSFNPTFKHVVALTGSLTDFLNPFITTYETREERSLGVRTYFEVLSRDNALTKWSWRYGLEAQQTSLGYRNYENIQGRAGEKQDFADFRATQSFMFTHFTWEAFKRFTAEAAMSLNSYKYNFAGIYPVAAPEEKRSFKTQLMPRVALSYLLTDYLAMRASVSRGYSPPTIEEVRPSDRVINTELEPESGWNYESGLRLSLFNNRVYFDGVIFYYNQQNAIVRRVNASDSEFFVNAGGTRQAGLETQLSGWLISPKNAGFIRGFKISEAYTHSNFKFDKYKVESADFSDNELTGVPEHNLVSSLELHFPLQTKLYFQHNFVSSIPLNDANTAYADKYHLLQAKCSWQKRTKNIMLNLFAGADNLLNIDYSLGNDLNAFGSRFFNPAAPRNYYGGINVVF